ncbi:short-chain dehydrogenase/reductase SDR [Rubrobacter xylanophilus DSM 9941]|uniref:Short-chain dehydrogenase/reductase SDR n=1 Tax=Rubrobacter xylanophilus (strain DSM 9941 / JCM 11954 / NBRC 16129 / PRD-1) TaxID=266117 RepID=Q1ARR1_RUBXD|nr:3-oxoacyl-ACP reductase family protein [Rubrobacter xylanophilus]ABG05917.1 short-chain dehydrogenase/reductase SDR [Rubrobacter xylanophilus DSM 9941]
MPDLSGKVAWVTGSSTGIGAACALALAREGCRVAVHYNRSGEEARRVVQKIEGSGGEALLVRGDVSDAAEVGRMAAEVEDRFGGLDFLVNNAGGLLERRPFSEMTEELWERVMEVNLKSVFLVSRAALPLMRRRGGGRIVNVTSIAARTGGGPGSSAYASAKGGVSTLTRAMAKELVSENILVNGVAPGVIATPFHDRYTPPEVRERLRRGIPIGREGTPEEVAGVVVFLLSPAADYLVGEIVEVNGGQLMD